MTKPEIRTDDESDVGRSHPLSAADALREELDELRAELESLRSEIALLRAPGTAPVHPLPDRRRTRRDLIRLAGAAGAVGAATGVARSGGPAAAADGDTVKAGQEVVSQSATDIRMNAGSLTGRESILAASDSNAVIPNTFNFRAALGGLAFGLRADNGVFAFTDARDDGTINTGHAVVAFATANARSNLYLVGTRTTPPTADTYYHNHSELVADDGGNLWHCVTQGTPGTWRRLSGALTAGALVPLTPVRVYDSRKNNAPTPNGPISTGQQRVIPVKDGRDVDTNAVTEVDIVPAGATAIVYNLTIVDMVGGGFLSVAPGDTASLGASTINWGPSTDGALANSSTVKLDGNRQLKVFGGGGSTDFIIDVLGYHA